MNSFIHMIHLANALCPAPEGTLSDREHLWKAVFEADTPEKQDKFFNSGGAGAFARPADYVKILAAVLNDGVSAKTGNRILKKETIDLMWENQIPQFPDFARMGAEPAVRRRSCCVFDISVGES